MGTSVKHVAKLQFWHIGRLAPIVLLSIGLADLASRNMSIDFLSHRSTEAVSLKQIPGSPCEPRKVFHKDHCYGDLAAMGNLPALRHYRTETFTTDDSGFRNLPSAANSHIPKALVVGSSFSEGQGVSDDETLAAQLSKLWGCFVYNGAGVEERLSIIRTITRRLHMQDGMVIYEFLERSNPDKEFLEFLQSEYPSMVPHVPSQQLADGENHPLLARFTRKFGLELRSLTVSRVGIMANKEYRLLQNDQFLPNLYMRQLLAIGRLKNGEAMLFLHDDVRLDQQRRDVSWAGPYWSWLARELRNDNLSLVVVLVPEKIAVYKPLLINQLPPPVEPVGYLDKIEIELHKANVPVVNLTPVFKNAARQYLEEGTYIYYPDDTHWNPLGIAIAAKTIASAQSNNPCSDAPTDSSTNR